MENQSLNLFNTFRLPNTVCDYTSKKPPRGEWVLFKFAQGGYSNNTFDIYTLVDNEGQTYMKPFQKYNKNEFENLFGFQRGCIDYNDDKIIFVRDLNFSKQLIEYMNRD